MATGKETNIKPCYHISVISPGHRAGNTTEAILIAMAFAYTQNRKTVITHTGTESDSLTTFLNYNIVEDKTNSMEQMSELIDHNLLSLEEAADFCSQIGTNLFLMDTSAPSMTRDRWRVATEKVIDKLSSYDIIVTDICGEIYDELTQGMLRKSDIVIVVLEQAIDTLSKFSAWRDSNYYDPIADVGELFVVNKFNSNVGSFKEYTKFAVLDHRYCSKISEISEIKKLSNNGKILQVMTGILNKDAKYATLNNEMRTLMKLICDNLGLLFIDWVKKKEPKLTKKAEAKQRSQSRSGRRKSKPEGGD